MSTERSRPAPRGFLLKDAGPALLTQAIHAAAGGDALIAPSVTVRLLAAFAPRTDLTTEAADRTAHWPARRKSSCL